MCDLRITLQLCLGFWKMYFRFNFSGVWDLEYYYYSAVLNICLRRKLEWPQSPLTEDTSLLWAQQRSVFCLCCSQPGSLDLLTPIPLVWKMEVAHQHWLANILAWFQTYMWCTGMKNRKIFKNLLVTLCDRVIAKTVSCVWHGSKIQSPAVLGMTLLGTGAWSLLYKWFQMCRGAWAELQTAQ